MKRMGLDTRPHADDGRDWDGELKEDSPREDVQRLRRTMRRRMSMRMVMTTSPEGDGDE